MHAFYIQLNMIPLKCLPIDDQLIFKAVLEDFNKLQCIIAIGTGEALKLQLQENTSFGSDSRHYLYLFLSSNKAKSKLPEYFF